MKNAQIIELVNEYNIDLVKHRRSLHELAELSSLEFKTSAYLKKEIEKLGLPIFEVEGTGFYAVLDTKRPGKTVGIRCDIDALPLLEPEYNLISKRQTISNTAGVMHACGHDGHMATVLVAAKVLVSLSDQLCGKVVFIFEEGEEIGSGIHQMVTALEKLDIDAIYGTHLAAFMDSGLISFDAGAVMSGASLFEFDVIGKGGHGSRPDLAVNPVNALANIIVSLNTAWNNQIDVTQMATLGITKLHASDALNVFSDVATCGGSIRFLNNEVGRQALEVLKNVVVKSAAVHNCEVSFKDNTSIVNYPVINDASLSEFAHKHVGSLYGDRVVSDVKWYASESFCHYAQLAPTLFAFVGIKNAELGSGADHHNQYFDIDEAALKPSLGSTLKFVIEFLNN